MWSQVFGDDKVRGKCQVSRCFRCDKLGADKMLGHYIGSSFRFAGGPRGACGIRRRCWGLGVLRAIIDDGNFQLRFRQQANKWISVICRNDKHNQIKSFSQHFKNISYTPFVPLISLQVSFSNHYTHYLPLLSHTPSVPTGSLRSLFARILRLL